MSLLVVAFLSVWSERYFDPVVIVARDILKEKVEIGKISVVVCGDDGLLQPIPFQVDEKENEEDYSTGDGIFSDFDEIVFCAKDTSNTGIENCRDKIKKFDSIFEVSLKDKKRNKTMFAYIVVGDNVPKSNVKYLHYSEDSENDIIESDHWKVFLEKQHPIIKRIDHKSESLTIFSGVFLNAYFKIFGVFDVRKNQNDIWSKTLYLKSGPVRFIRSSKPYVDIGFGIKIPSAKTTGKLYPGVIISPNTVFLPFPMKMIAKESEAVIFLKYNGTRGKRFISRTVNSIIGKDDKPKEDNHMWGIIKDAGEKQRWGTMYFIKDVSKIPVKRWLYYDYDNAHDIFNVGLNIDVLSLPMGTHKFELYGFTFPPGDEKMAMDMIENPLEVSVKPLNLN